MAGQQIRIRNHTKSTTTIQRRTWSVGLSVLCTWSTLKLREDSYTYLTWHIIYDRGTYTHLVDSLGHIQALKCLCSGSGNHRHPHLNGCIERSGENHP